MDALLSAYHITRIENLSAIWQSGRLLCDNDVSALPQSPESFSHEHIKERRRKTPVRAGRGGTLSEYVPFYFCNRSPMLATVYYRDQVTGSRDQDRIAHLRIDVQQIAEGGLQFVFTDGHAPMAVTGFYDDLSQVERLDWRVIQSKIWCDTRDDPDRKRRKQAEVLVHGRLPIGYIVEVGVRNARIKEEVERMVAEHAHRPPVTVRPEWYYP